jgi:hypothetical protein
VVHLSSSQTRLHGASVIIPAVDPFGRAQAGRERLSGNITID